MDRNTAIKLFEDKNIRVLWDESQGKWYFSIQDVVAALTNSLDTSQYIKKMRSRDPMLNANWGTICTPVEMIAADGKKRKIQAADTEQLFRLIQAIPSSKAEPFKMWLAKVGSERVDEIADPELAINRALQTYMKKGYSENWVNQRLKTIEIRRGLTDEWSRAGVKEGIEYAILTDEICKAWTGMTTKEYKNLKGLKKENLRDNMTNMELVLNMLAEVTTAEIAREKNPSGLSQSRKIAHEGGQVAGNTREDIEKRTGKKIITNKNAHTLKQNLSNLEDKLIETGLVEGQESKIPMKIKE